MKPNFSISSRLFGSLICLILVSSLLGQALNNSTLKYQPKNLDEALTQLHIIIPDSTKEKFRLMNERNFMASAHFGTGMWIRNHWLYNRYLLGLIVTQSDLRKYFLALGVYHNDDMSSIILRSFHRQLNNKEIDVEKQILAVFQHHIDNIHKNHFNVLDTETRSAYLADYVVGDTLIFYRYSPKKILRKSQKIVEIQSIITDMSNYMLSVELSSYRLLED